MNRSAKPGHDRPTTADATRFAYAPGARPLDSYTIQRGIGQGGFGEVYHATSDAGKEVALKLIRRGLDVEVRGVKQCLNLKHPHLLALYDLRGDTQGNQWVVMEYVAGGCLTDAMDRQPGGMSADAAMAWFHGIASAVGYLHDKGIVHRDLKPGNIFADEGHVKVGDYGLSKFISSERRSGHTESVGTVHYMAPEVANGRYGKEIDIYALGVLLYEMLTGRVPFEGQSVGEVLMKHLTATPDVSMLAEPYQSVVARALKKDPAERFASVEQMAAALPRPVGAGESLGTVPPNESSDRTFRNYRDDLDADWGEPIMEEPVLRAVHEVLNDLGEAWRSLNTPAKVILAIVGFIAFMTVYPLVITLGVFSLILYGGYRVVRAMVFGGARTRSWSRRAPAAQPRTVPPRSKRPPVERQRGQRFFARDKAAPAMIVKPPRERLAELVGSMLLGAAVIGVLGLLMVAIGACHGQTPRPEQCAWVALVALAGSWAVLLVSKPWEGSRGEPALRRFVLLVVGLALGTFAWALSRWLMIALPHDTAFAAHELPMPSALYSGGPTLWAFIVVFGTLLPVMRWWRQTDPLRGARLSLWTLFITAITSGVVAWAWSFPQPWLVVTACTMSAAVQLASPWQRPVRQPWSEE